MELVLDQKPQNVTIIEGFPGFGFVGTISVEFLIEHLGAKKIGKITSNDVMPVAAVHNSQLIEPFSIYYSKKKNLVLLHAITNVQGLEWQLSDKVIELYKKLKAKKIISLEGIGSTSIIEPKVFYYTNRAAKEKVQAETLKEGIIMGVSGALLLKAEVPLSCFFAETHSSLPDSKAAEFEEKLKNIVDKSKVASDQKEKKELDYFG